MYYVDGILPPDTIKSGMYVVMGQAYYCLGNFVGMITPKVAEDWEGVNFSMEFAR